MRAKTTLVVVIGMLFCSLIALEIPELLNLQDDTSNDFSLVSSQENLGAVVENQTVRVETARPMKPLHSSKPVARFESHNPPPSADDYLNSLCILRT
jgi:hypothetical protein